MSHFEWQYDQWNRKLTIPSQSRFLHFREAAVRVQARQRRRIDALAFSLYRRLIVRLQAWARAQLQRRRFGERRGALAAGAVALQRCYRGHIDRTTVAAYQHLVTVIQAAFRGFATRRHLLLERAERERREQEEQRRLERERKERERALREEQRLRQKRQHHWQQRRSHPPAKPGVAAIQWQEQQD